MSKLVSHFFLSSTFSKLAGASSLKGKQDRRAKSIDSL